MHTLPSKSAPGRILSIDLLRGVVMVIMALDHVRMYFGEGTWYAEPTNLATTTPLLFFTRWITHFCAPVFVFLAGTSAFLYGVNTSRKQVAWFLFTRGLWLIFVEAVIVTFEALLRGVRVPELQRQCRGRPRWSTIRRLD